MTPRPPPLALLKTFEVAARHLSFKRAAEELHVTPAAVSLQIRTLEQALGAPLFVRLTRAIALTEAGERLLPGVRLGLQQLADAVQAVRSPAPGRPLQVTAPPSFASHWLLPRLAGFQAAHPDVDLRLVGSSDAVDRRGEPASPGRLGDDAVAIVFGQGRHPGLRVEAVLAPHYVPVCAPGLVSAQRPLAVPEDLRHHALIHDDTLRPDGGPPWGWTDWLRAAGVGGVDGTRGLRLSNAVLAIDAALAGRGVLLAARPFVAEHLRAGRLVAPLALDLPAPFAYHLLSAPGARPGEAVAAFRDWLMREAAAG